MNLIIESDNTKLMEHLKELTESCAIPSQVAALNSTATTVRNKSVTIARVAAGVPTKILRKRIVVPKSRRATSRRLEVIIFGGIWPIKVMKLTPTPRKLKKGVKYKVLPGETQNPIAFMANNTNGAMSVFARKGPNRLPLKNITVNIEPHVKKAVGGFIDSGAAKAYYQKMLFSQLDRRIRSSMVRKGMKVT